MLTTYLRLIALCLVPGVLFPIPSAFAVGQSCNTFTAGPCPSTEYCDPVVFGTCKARRSAKQSCTGLGQGTCLSGLQCDVRGECRHVPSRLGEFCGTGVSCNSDTYCSGGRCVSRRDAQQSCTGLGQGTCKTGLACDVSGECRNVPGKEGDVCGLGVDCELGLVCDADVGGSCRLPGQSGDSCSGVGQGSCDFGLLCDATRVCRNDPPLEGEPCGGTVSCGGTELYCNTLVGVGGLCAERGDGTDACTGLGQGTCKTGLLCDVAGECRNVPGQLGEFCGLDVPCDEENGFFCSADIGGRCGERGTSGFSCSGTGQGSCANGLVCDITRVCRNDPPLEGEVCNLESGCAEGSYCNANVDGICGPRGTSSESCSGFGQGSCESGLVCDGLAGQCRQDPPVAGEVCIAASCASGLFCEPLSFLCKDAQPEGAACGPLNQCDAGLFCQPGSQVCKQERGVGDGCSAVNFCGPNLSCEPCLTESCDHPFQCFPNSANGPLSSAQCRALYDVALHQRIVNGEVRTPSQALGLAINYSSGTALSGLASGTYEVGVIYGANGEYGCYTTSCVGANIDVSATAFLQIGFYDKFENFSGTSIAVVEGASAGVVGFSTSQIFAPGEPGTISLGPLIGTEDTLSAGASPDDWVLPVSVGTYQCETEVDQIFFNEPGPEPGPEPRDVAPVCGNGVLDPGEACDDENISDGDGCSKSCAIESRCGDSILDIGESCDDGGNIDGDGCSATCKLEPFCGDGNIDLGEACDDGANESGDGCSATCTVEAICGNGLQESGEACDDNNLESGDGCSAICVQEFFCGDGEVNPGEYCDDGNAVNNDLCSNTCRVNIEQEFIPIAPWVLFALAGAIGLLGFRWHVSRRTR